MRTANILLVIFALLSVVGGITSACLTIEKRDNNDPSGRLTAGEIKHVVQQNLDQIRHCYELFLKRQPGAAAKATTQFFIEPDGSVSGQELKEVDNADDGLKHCVLSRLGSWKFPQYPNGKKAKVTYPFIFKPE